MSMTTRQTPDAVREAEIAKMARDLIPSYEDRGSGYDKTLAVLRYVAALDSRAGDAGEDHNGGRCPGCDGTGDVHRIDGEWLGTCHCPAGTFSNPSTFGKPTFGVAATPAPAVDAVPAGWQLVPIEPTRAMLNAAAVADDGSQAHYLDAYRATWAAMLAALSHGEGR